MSELRLRDGSILILKNVMDALKGMFVDVNFECLVDGLFLAMGVDSVLTVTLFLKSDGFEHYIFDKNTTISFNVPTMVNLLECRWSDDVISIKVDDKKGTVKVTMQDPFEIRKFESERRQMKIPSVPIQIPTVEFNAIAHLCSRKFVGLCEDHSNNVKSGGGTSVTISVTKDRVRFQCKYVCGYARWSFRQNIDCEIWMAQPEQEQVVSLTYPLKYFDYISKVAPLQSRVSMSFSKDGVIVIEYEILEKVQMRFYLTE